MKLFKNRKGVFDNLQAIGMGIITFVVIAAVAALILGSFRTGLPTNTGSFGCAAGYTLKGTQSAPPASTGLWCEYATNASQPNGTVSAVLDYNVSSTVGYGQVGTSTIASWIPVIIVVAVGAVLIAMVAGFFMRKR